MNSHWKAILGVILIFILGFASGVVCSSIFVHRKMAAFLQHPGVLAQAALEKKLTHNLVLDENQKRQIHSFFQENLESRRELNKQIQPSVRAVNLETFQKIRLVLRPDQQELFRQNLEEFRKRFKVAANADLENIPEPGNSSPHPGSNTPSAH